MRIVMFVTLTATKYGQKQSFCPGLLYIHNPSYNFNSSASSNGMSEWEGRCHRDSAVCMRR